MADLPNRDEWKSLVEAAIKRGEKQEPGDKLTWVPAFGTHWDLRGNCPFCHHLGFSYVDDFTIRRVDDLTSRLFRRAGSAPRKERPDPVNGLHIRCMGEGCGTAHGEEGTGCGAGMPIVIDHP